VKRRARRRRERGGDFIYIKKKGWMKMR